MKRLPSGGRVPETTWAVGGLGCVTLTSFKDLSLSGLLCNVEMVMSSLKMLFIKLEREIVYKSRSPQCPVTVGGVGTASSGRARPVPRGPHARWPFRAPPPQWGGAQPCESR